MDREVILKLLNEHGSEIRERFGVKRFALIGSVARDQAADESDVDMLVEFEGPETFHGYFGLKFFLEDLFKKPVDVVTETGLRPAFRPYVEEEVIEISKMACVS
ncbi:nucleotidyltransferase family protein [soil metagenome]